MRNDHALPAPLPGRWACDLSDASLRWSPEVYALFGLPAGARLSRPNTLALYLPESREIMGLLRRRAITERSSFTMDAQIRRPDGALRWMRLSADVLIRNGRVTHLAGTKLDVTHEMAARRPFIPG